MKELHDFLSGYVKSKGADVKVLVNGEYTDVNVPGVTETKDNDFDVYLVNNTGIDPDVADIANVIVYCSNKKIDYNPKGNPEKTMRLKSHRQNVLSPNLVVYSVGSLPVVAASEPEPTPEPPKPVFEEPVGTTVDPSVIGTPLSISGGVSELDEPENNEPETTDDIEPKVW